MSTVRLVDGTWSTEASRAATFGERFRGLRGEDADTRLLFETSSVHTFGMTRSISVVMIDYELRVVRAQTLSPNRVVFEPRARFILEMPDHSDLPALGSAVEIVDV